VGNGNLNLKDRIKSRPRSITDSLYPKITHFLKRKCPRLSYSPTNPGDVCFYFFHFPTRWYYDTDLYALAMVRHVRTSFYVYCVQYGGRSYIYRERLHWCCCFIPNLAICPSL